MKKDKDLFMPLVEKREFVDKVFKAFKSQWKGTEWGFEVRERDGDLVRWLDGNGFDGDPIYEVAIFCGIGPKKLCVFRESKILNNPDFAKKAYDKESVWDDLILSICLHGAVPQYQRTVLLHRNGQIESNGIPYGENPMTPEEVFTNQENNNNEKV